MDFMTAPVSEVLYKTPAEIEAWLLLKRAKPLDQRFLRWLVLDALFVRQHGLCARCSSPLGRLVDMDVDHVVPRSKGGGDELSNLQLLGTGCHRRKTGEDLSNG